MHARRKFVELENIRAAEYKTALGFIASLYQIEADLAGANLAEIMRVRKEKSTKIVDDYFHWLRSFDGSPILATNSKLRNAIKYSLDREESLRVFLRNPELQLDTNHLEREIRPIAIGRKNWMFFWTEVGAESLCLAQSLIRTCLLQGVNPREYLIDVLQRITTREHSPDEITTLIPRFWKEEVKEKMNCPSLAAVKKASSFLG